MKSVNQSAPPDPAEVVCVGVAILAVAVATRVPDFVVSDPDAPFFAEIAAQWRAGALPYAGAFDVKPPGLFAFVAVVQSLRGAGHEALRGAEIACCIAICLGLYRLGRTLLSRAAGLWAALLYPFYSIAIDNLSAAPAIVLVVWAYVAALTWRGLAAAAVAGLLLGSACAIKQTYAFEALALLATIVWRAGPGRRLPPAAVYCAAAAVAPLGFALYFAAHGAFGAMISDVVVIALARSGGATEGLGPTDIVPQFLALHKGRLVPFLLCALALLRLKKIQALTPQAPLGAIAGWLAAAVAGALIQRASYESYLSPLTPPMLLLAAATLDRGAPELARIARPARFAAAAALGLAALAVFYNPAIYYPEDEDALRQAAAAVAGRAQPVDRMLVVNRGLWLYPMTGLHPPTAFFHPMHTLCVFAGAGGGALADALAARPRFIVVADERVRTMCERDDRWDAVHRALGADYVLLTRAAGAAEAFDIYEAKAR